jgi:non-ribosomal peptide synthetase component F
MITCPRTQGSRLPGSDYAAFAPAGIPGASRKTTVRSGDDLLHHLPLDRESMGASGPLAVAVRRITSVDLDRLYETSAELEASCDTFILTTFAILLARLAGQQLVNIRNILAPAAVLAWDLSDTASFRTLLASTVAGVSGADRVCAVEFICGTGEFSSTDTPGQGLRMAVRLSETGCHIQLKSSTGLWAQPTLQLWLRYFDRLLKAACDAPDLPWKLLPLVEPLDALAFYQALNATALAYPENMCVHELVARQALQTPDAPAIASESGCLTYRQLHQRSHEVARRLQALGAGPDRPVAICLERTAALPVMLLGILKSGSCYVPLDQRDSPLRLAAILEECRPVAMIVDRSFPSLPGADAIPVISPDDLQDFPADLECITSAVRPEHQAYIIYTSGTTGKPKGVMIQHRALFNLLYAMMRAPGLTSADRMLAISPISFDIATMDMFLPLVAGGTLVVADQSCSNSLTSPSSRQPPPPGACWRLLSGRESAASR